MVCMVEYNTTFSLDSVLFFMGLKIAELGEYSMSIPSMVLLWGLFVSLSPRNTTLKLSRNHDLNNFAPTNISP